MKLFLKILIPLALVLGLIFYLTSNSSTANGESVSQETETVAGSLQTIAALPSQVKESSGIITLAGKDAFLTHNDAGNQPYLYELNQSGSLTNTIKLDVTNKDWEDLTQDKDGNLYIADTGNNDNKRRDLTIYKVHPGKPTEIETIKLTYEDQTKFPPAKKERNFDCEAIFWHNGTIYLISKDRGRKQTAKVYTVPAKAGTHTAKLIGEAKTNSAVTGAAISPDAETIALVSEGKVHLFANVADPATFFSGKMEEISLQGAGQTEAVAFEDNNTMVITSEGGNLYKYKLN
ncbi:SdiA-regulated/phytase-like domain-containing protein [Pontibacter arcticus]|uniref:SdiA-regulated n=1 Tax=Pontibacter arcticus TaxID=2080288 RepID=A0A364RGU2_9BACT|nr:hypothetical protein [Pontibacter arcticus]RAU83560.1 hypothetical protein DP923_00310 [Pontibacter arcticus]